MGLKQKTYSLPILKNLVNSKTSSVFCFENCRKCFYTAPAQLGNLKVVLKEHLASKVSSYDSEFRGIIMSYKNVKVLNSAPLSDDGEHRLDFNADIYVFKPTIGNILTGTVNKKSQDHLGVLVHSFFNATIHRQRDDSECHETWLGADVMIGEQVTFEVLKVNFLSKLPYIKGQLIDIKKKNSECEDGGISGYENNEECSSRTQEDSDFSEERNRSNKKSNTHHKKKHSLLDLQSSLISEVIAGQTHSPFSPRSSLPNSSFCFSSIKHDTKSKKRKRNSSLSEIENSLITETVEHVTSEAFSDVQPKKKKKKRSDSFVVPDDNGMMLESENLGATESTIQNLISSEISSLKPKKKKSSLSLSNNVSQDENLPITEESHTSVIDGSFFSVSHKKKKKRSKEKNEFFEEIPNLSEGTYESQQESSSNVSKRKKKKKSLLGD